MTSPLQTYRWLAVAGLTLTLQAALAQNAPAPAPANTAIPAARPATGNATPAQAKPNTAAPQPATAAPKTAEPSKTPPAATTKPAEAKPAATPAAADQGKSAETKSEAAPEATPKKKAGAEPPPCIVADFRAIGIDTQDAEKRRARALNWIARRGKQCTAQQLLVMRNNRSQWLGTGDSGAVAASIDALLEGFAETNPDIALLLYGTPPPPPPPDPKDKKAPAK